MNPTPDPDLVNCDRKTGKRADTHTHRCTHICAGTHTYAQAHTHTHTEWREATIMHPLLLWWSMNQWWYLDLQFGVPISRREKKVDESSFRVKPPCQLVQHLMQAIIRHVDNAVLIIAAMHCHWQAIIRHTGEKTIAGQLTVTGRLPSTVERSQTNAMIIQGVVLWLVPPLKVPRNEKLI